MLGITPGARSKAGCDLGRRGLTLPSSGSDMVIRGKGRLAKAPQLDDGKMQMITSNE